MTSTVKVTAHCTPDKEVVVKRVDDVRGTADLRTLQDKESTEMYVYDDWRVEVGERVKET